MKLSLNSKNRILTLLLFAVFCGPMVFLRFAILRENLEVLNGKEPSFHSSEENFVEQKIALKSLSHSPSVVAPENSIGEIEASVLIFLTALGVPYQWQAPVLYSLEDYSKKHEALKEKTSEFKKDEMGVSK